jgi:hypothetical protein
MNAQDIKNPHLIFPGQILRLDKRDGRARMSAGARAGGAADEGAIPDVRWSPRTRYESLAPDALPTLKSHLVEPFLVEPIIVDEARLESAARIVAAQQGRYLLTRGDRAYARGQGAQALVDDPKQKQQAYRVFRDARPLKDPTTGEVLGYEAQYVGKAVLVRGESTEDRIDAEGKRQTDIVPATIDIVNAREEIRLGDRLLPEPPQQLLSYVPHAPRDDISARIVSVYGNAVVNAGQNQVVAINLGTRDGIERGHMMAIMKDGARMIDKTDAALTELKLPNERNGMLMVFLTFEKVSYALVLDTTDAVRVGDRLLSPR